MDTTEAPWGRCPRTGRPYGIDFFPHPGIAKVLANTRARMRRAPPEKPRNIEDIHRDYAKLIAERHSLRFLNAKEEGGRLTVQCAGGVTLSIPLHLGYSAKTALLLHEELPKGASWQDVDAGRVKAKVKRRREPMAIEKIVITEPAARRPEPEPAPLRLVVGNPYRRKSKVEAALDRALARARAC